MYEYEICKETKESPKSTLNWTRPVTNPVAKRNGRETFLLARKVTEGFLMTKNITKNLPNAGFITTTTNI